ncbi:oxidoreductase [Dietzia cinnamea]|uniref:oxidoreductase n=1 Tax=Dietzia cinnamea TaxID=321318 RepID=UPI0007C67BCB|nr:oxidoreductase [Dietzia cinnamea]MCT1638405.1 oxidoreductase [Dietzia cinnamea]MCT2273004.1 oxidoreductase [Dietzia cinnamea]OAH47514.1 short-chain dehydrogenase [Dietzia cinnamea]
MSRWTTADIPDQTGRTFVITGANSGLGLQSTRALTEAGARVLMACRDTTRAEAARAELAHPERAEIVELDLADLGSVRAAGEVLGGRAPDVLINNAGLMNIPRSRTAQGHEMQFGVNVLGHFALTELLAPALTDRVVWLGSIMHRFGSVDPDDLDWTRRRYVPMTAYAASKLACVMLAYEQQRRLEVAGSSLKAVAAHPGYSATNLQYRSGSRVQDLLMKGVEKIPYLVQPAERGALPQLYAATVESVPGGAYIGPDGPGELTGYPTTVQSTRASHDPDVAAALWERCAQMTAA